MIKRNTHYRPDRVAQLALCSRQNVYVWIRTGKLQAKRIGTRWFIPAEEVAQLLGVPVTELPVPEAA